MADNIILVDEHDNELGTGEKLAVHKAGLLHRCFSIFVFNSEGQLLLQKRARGKYHSGGLWTNTTCSHPRPGESDKTGAKRRLQQEMGMSVDLEEKFTFTYRAELDNGITEHEFDHVFFGVSDSDPVPDPEEAEAWKWVDMDWLAQDISDHPEHYSVWLKACFNQVLRQLPSFFPRF